MGWRRGGPEVWVQPRCRRGLQEAEPGGILAESRGGWGSVDADLLQSRAGPSWGQRLGGAGPRWMPNHHHPPPQPAAACARCLGPSKPFSTPKVMVRERPDHSSLVISGGKP